MHDQLDYFLTLYDSYLRCNGYLSLSAVGALLFSTEPSPTKVVLRFDLISIAELHSKMTEHLQSNVSQDLVWEICRMFRYAITSYGPQS